MAKSAKKEKRTAGSGFFTINDLRQLFLNLKEFPELGLFGSMTSRSINAVIGIPVGLVLMPLIAVALFGLAILDIYTLIRAPNKNIDKWLQAFVGSLCALLAGTSISSFVLGNLFGFTFVAGPWFFLSSVLVFSLYNIFNMGLTFFRLFEAPMGSPQQKHYIQRLIFQLNMMITAAAIIGCVFTVILFPVSAPLATFFAVLTVVMTVGNIAWRFMPESYKETIKGWFGLAKGETETVKIVEQLQATPDQENSAKLNAGVRSVKFEQRKGIIPGHYLTAPDYLSQVKSLSPADQITFMEQMLKAYQFRLDDKGNTITRVQSKLQSVEDMIDNLERMREGKPLEEVRVKGLNQVCQSFFRESSRLEAIKAAYDYVAKEYVDCHYEQCEFSVLST